MAMCCRSCAHVQPHAQGSRSLAGGIQLPSGGMLHGEQNDRVYQVTRASAWCKQVHVLVEAYRKVLHVHFAISGLCPLLEGDNMEI